MGNLRIGVVIISGEVQMDTAGLIGVRELVQKALDYIKREIPQAKIVDPGSGNTIINIEQLEIREEQALIPEEKRYLAATLELDIPPLHHIVVKLGYIPQTEKYAVMISEAFEKYLLMETREYRELTPSHRKLVEKILSEERVHPLEEYIQELEKTLNKTRYKPLAWLISHLKAVQEIASEYKVNILDTEKHGYTGIFMYTEAENIDNILNTLEILAKYIQKFEEKYREINKYNARVA